ncbi:hypothetical protein GGR56DRAFT_617974 [Xylariaceae sp. FL0804]|nr:hypothetical protein GGR56DRAFT_617974 [Xylariaceae sp. FL0804]
MSYAQAAASGPKQTPQEAAAPPPPQIVSSQSASTSSLVDVDTPSVRTVPSDFASQDVQTDTQAAREEREEEEAEAVRARRADKAKAEAKAKEAQAKRKARRADGFLTQWFAGLGEGPLGAVAAANLAAVVGLSSYMGYKAWGLYERGQLRSKHLGIGAGVVLGVGVIEGFLGRYLYKGKKAQSS